MRAKKNRNRSQYTFANINLLGECNADCFFCLGKDIEDLLSVHDQTRVHFSEWKNFEKFIQMCKVYGITKIYVTGQNTDSLCYKYLGELIDHLQDEHGFTVGLRTNAKLALAKQGTIRKCRDEIGYSINALSDEATQEIMGWKKAPDFNWILNEKNDNTRVSVVVCRRNLSEIFDIIRLCKEKGVRYVQLRRISTDTRYEELKDDIDAYDDLLNFIRSAFPLVGGYETAECYDIHGIQVSLWATVCTTANSVNYFTDGTVSDEYFVIEGYLKNRRKNDEFIG